VMKGDGSQVFGGVEEAMKCFQSKRYIGDYQLNLPAAFTIPRERGRFG
jgi:hypothetical protein